MRCLPNVGAGLVALLLLACGAIGCSVSDQTSDSRRRWLRAGFTRLL